MCLLRQLCAPSHGSRGRHFWGPGMSPFFTVFFIRELPLPRINEHIWADVMCEQPSIKRYSFKVFWRSFSQCTPVTGRKDTKSLILKTPPQKSIIECTKGWRKCCFMWNTWKGQPFPIFAFLPVTGRKATKRILWGSWAKRANNHVSTTGASQHI